MSNSGSSDPISLSSPPIALDLFSGAGGMSLGFQMAGYKIALGIEQEENSWRTHCYNFEGHCHKQDIRTIEDPRALLLDYRILEVDVIIGGPPCQGFSKVGRGKLRKLLNNPDYIHDPRNSYYQEFIRFIKVLKPFYFVMENVPDLVFYNDGKEELINKIIHTFSDLEYTVEWAILQADHYSVPQTRRRLFLIGNRIGQKICWPEEDRGRNTITVWDAISDLPIVPDGHRQDEMNYLPRCELNNYQKLMRTGMRPEEIHLLFNHQTRRHNQQDIEAFELMPLGGKYIDLPKKYKRYRDDIFKDKYRKLYRDRPSWTIEAHIGKDTYRHIYPTINGEPEPPRTISVREAARLQSFPDHFRFFGPFTQQFHQVGNAVPPLLAKTVAKAIFPGVLFGLEEKNLQRYAENRAKWRGLKMGDSLLQKSSEFND